MTGLGRQGDADYHVFDVLWLDGRDVTALPLDERRALLTALPLQPPLAPRRSRSTTTRRGSAPAREGWEGVIAKRRDSPYEHRRSPHWLKMKCEASQELVVGGFTDPQGARVGLGALLVGYFDGDDFVFAGKVGTGFDTTLLLDLRARLDALEIADAAVHEGRPACRALRAHWVRPEIVVQVAFIEWTVHGKLRHPRLLGVRDRQGARATSCGSSRDHASREGAVPRRRHHQGRARRVLRGGRAGHAAAHPRPAGHDGALSRAASARRASSRRTSSKGFPDWLERVEVPKKGGTVHHPLVDDARSLLWLANQNSITPHVWTSRAPRPLSARTSASSISIRRDDDPDVLRAAALGAARPARRSSACRAG